MTLTQRIRAARATGKNVGGAERFVRSMLGQALFAVGLASLAGVLAIATGTTGLAAGLLLVLAGARMTQTAITQTCYVNALLGRNSCRLKPETGDAVTADEM